MLFAMPMLEDTFKCYNTTAQVFFSSHPLICPGHKQTKGAPPWRTSLTLNAKHSVWNCAKKAGHELTSMARSQHRGVAQLKIIDSRAVCLKKVSAISLKAPVNLKGAIFLIKDNAPHLNLKIKRRFVLYFCHDSTILVLFDDALKNKYFFRNLY